MLQYHIVSYFVNQKILYEWNSTNIGSYNPSDDTQANYSIFNVVNSITASSNNPYILKSYSTESGGIYGRAVELVVFSIIEPFNKYSICH